MKIYILSSTHAATGGTELLQQLCYQLIKFGVDVKMYYTEEYDGSNVQNKFEPIYHNPVASSIDCGSVGIIPETEIDNYFRMKKAFSKVYFWWLSVDNYYGSGRFNCGFTRQIYRKIKHIRNIDAFKKNEHCVQSEYARRYLIEELGINASKIYDLSDYLNEDYLKNIDVDISKKENIILYNPKKGIEFTQMLMKEISEYEWIPLAGMTNQQLKKTFSRAKVYVDFGNHPGKDRIPREAAIHYCCVITGKRGAANNDVDIPIPNEYKFEDKYESIGIIHERIKDCMNMYETRIGDYNTYRLKILQEKGVFEECAKGLFNSK